MAKKLYVGNFSYRMSDADLEEMLSPCGEVRSEQVLVVNRARCRTGRPPGAT